MKLPLQVPAVARDKFSSYARTQGQFLNALLPALIFCNPDKLCGQDDAEWCCCKHQDCGTLDDRCIE
jgi:hypothetical protein